MANSNGWGDGAANNTIGWGQGANNSISWGKSHSLSNAGLTDIVGVAGEPTYDTNAAAFFSSAGITDVTQKIAINNLVIGLKADGLWTSMYAIYPFVGGTASTHKWNLKDPRDLNAAYRLQFNGGMTHSSNGILFNGTNGWADTSAINTIRTFGVYTRNSTDNGKIYMGTQNTIFIDDGEGNVYPYISGAYSVSYSTYIISDFYSFRNTNNTIRTGLSSIISEGGSEKYYKNGILKDSDPINDLSNAGFNMAIGAINPNSDIQGGTPPGYGFSNQQIAFAFMGSTSFNATQNANLYTRVQAFQTALSRNV
jgi:hypothetical protein